MAAPSGIPQSAYHPVSNEQFDVMIDSVVTIPRKAFEVVVGLFLGLTAVTLAARLFFKLKAKHKLEVDDYLLIGALGLMAGDTAVGYQNLDHLYLASALHYNPALAAVAPPERMLAMAANLMKASAILNALVWATIFIVKASFLVLFRSVIRNVNGIQIWYWTVCVIIFIAWAFNFTQMFIICPHPGGPESVKCMNTDKWSLSMGLTIAAAVLDCFTDLLIISIPVIILYKVKIKLKQKLAVGTFLCLSVVMIILAIIRVSKIRNNAGGLDVVWESLWMYLESVVAVLMGSLTAFRSVFVASMNSHKERTPSTSIRKFGFRKKHVSGEPDQMRQLPAVPRATMTGLRTFIRRHDKPVDDWTLNSNATADTYATTDTFRTEDELDLMGLRKSGSDRNASIGVRRDFSVDYGRGMWHSSDRTRVSSQGNKSSSSFTRVGSSEADRQNVAPFSSLESGNYHQ